MKLDAISHKGKRNDLLDITTSERVGRKLEVTGIIGKEKIVVELAKLVEELVSEVSKFATDKMLQAIQIKDKLEKYAAIDKVKEDSVTYFEEKYKESEELEKIKDVIGRGGEMITKIILEASHVKTVQDKDAVKVDLEDDGRVIVYHSDPEIIKTTIEMIKSVAREVEIGATYNVRVTSIQEFGAFVELWPGCEGLIHVSQLDIKRVAKVSDVVKVGDELLAIATGYDKKGKLNLSRKELLSKKDIKED